MGLFSSKSNQAPTSQPSYLNSNQTKYQFYPTAPIHQTSSGTQVSSNRLLNKYNWAPFDDEDPHPVDYQVPRTKQESYSNTFIQNSSMFTPQAVKKPTLKNMSPYMKKWEKLIGLEEEPMKDELKQLKRTSITQLISTGKAISSLKYMNKEADHGKYIISLKTKSDCQFKSGETVNIYNHTNGLINLKGADPIFSGIVYSTSPKLLEISVSRLPQNLNGLKDLKLLCVRFPNFIMFEKFKGVLHEVRKIFKSADDNQALLIQSLIDLDFSVIPSPEKISLSKFFNPKLNREQAAAVTEAINTRLIYALQGPPGTGKSTVIKEVVQQLILMNKRVLVCSSNNKSTDHLALPLIGKGYNLLRVGNQVKVEENVWPILLSHKISQDPMMQKFNNDENFYLKSMAMPETSQEIKTIRSQRNKHSDNLKKKFFKSSNVVFSTINGAKSDILREIPKKLKFDYVIIDECAQSPEVATWLPMLNGAKIILAGDHYQLPCCVSNPIAAQEGYGISLLERIFDKLPKSMKRTLEIQYRMNKYINEWPSQQFYKGRLLAGESNKERTLLELLKPRYESKSAPIMKLISTQRDGFTEKRAGTSYVNISEAAHIITQVKNLLKYFNLKQEEIGIITPYSAQTKLIQAGLEEIGIKEVEVASVDSFQGREKEVVLLSFVRSNPIQSFGFTCDPRRLNVAVTRAKRALIVVCDARFMKKSEIVKSLLDNFGEDNKCDYEQLEGIYQIVNTLFESFVF